MNAAADHRPVRMVALLATAAVTGAIAGLVTAAFIWLVDEGTELLWTDLPDRFGVDAFDSWWLFAVPIAGGALVGLGQMTLGNYPEPLDDVIERLKDGGRIDPKTTAPTFLNSLVALVFGGPVGFEAALTGIAGGLGAWASDRISTVRQFMDEARDADQGESSGRAIRQLPYVLAALTGLFAYRWFPFGGIDLGFRFEEYSGRIGVREGLITFAFAALMVVPAAWAIAVAGRAERATFFRRSPILVGMAGGIVFAVLAIPNSLVLFSGQQGIALLPDTGSGELVYVTFAKWLALVIALYAGWRGGPIFPTFTAASAFAVLADEVTGIGPELMMVAAMAGVSVVFVKGRIALAAVLMLYPVPLPFIGPILVGCLGGAVALAIARSLGALPTPETGAPPDTETPQAAS